MNASSHRKVQRRVLLELILATVAVLVLLALLGTADAQKQGRLAEHSAQQHALSVENGAALYGEHCRSCHGVRGEGVGQLGPALNDRGFFEQRLAEVGWQGTLTEYIRSTVAQGRVTATRPLYAGDGAMAMAPWSQALGGPLRPDEIEDITAFVLNWRASALGEFQPVELVLPSPTPASSAQQTAAGREIWLAAGCSRCHRIADVPSDGSGPDLTHIASVARTRVPDLPAEAYLRESFLLPDLFVVEGYTGGAGCGGVLSQSQLNDLIAYLLTLE